MRWLLAPLALAMSFCSLADVQFVDARFKFAEIPADGPLHWGDVLQLQPSTSVCAKGLSELPLVDSTLPGRQRYIDRPEVTAALDQMGLTETCRIQWSGPSFTVIRKRGQALDFASVQEQVGEALRYTLAQHYQSVAVRALESHLTSAEASADARFEYTIPADAKPQPRMMIIARLVERDGTARTFPLWYSVTARQNALVLQKSVIAGQTLAADSVLSDRVEVSAQRDDLLPNNADFVLLIAKAPLSAGTVLRKSQFVIRPEIEVGDRVSLRYRSRGISIDATAVALQSSRLGQRVLVRAPVGNEVISARTISRGVAEVLQ